jgi:hypothetical protein
MQLQAATTSRSCQLHNLHHDEHHWHLDLGSIKTLHTSSAFSRHCCKENGPLAHLVWILVFDDQHDHLD